MSQRTKKETTTTRIKEDKKSASSSSTMNRITNEQVGREIPDRYKDAHAELVTGFISAIMNRGLLSRLGAICIFVRLVRESRNNSYLREITDVRTIVLHANERLGPFGFQIRKTRDESTGNLFFCFVNTVDDDIAKAVKGHDDWMVGLFTYFFDQTINK
jgi:Nse1 non-SMC component of SMC5-6 complex